MHYLLFFEFLGTTELLVILFVALVIFGPRKLPEMGRSLGQALQQLRSASNDFKRTWEAEALTEDPMSTAPGRAAPALPQAAAVSYAKLSPGGLTAEEVYGAEETTQRESSNGTLPVGFETGVLAEKLQLT